VPCRHAPKAPRRLALKPLAAASQIIAALLAPLLCDLRLSSFLCIQVVDQDMMEPGGQRMQELIKDLRTVECTEKPVGNKEWVACDECEKWRKVPRGFQFDRTKNFFCKMIPKLSCDTAEEAWEQNEKSAGFIDADWVLASWDRIRKELVKEKQKLDAAARLADTFKTYDNGDMHEPHQQLTAIDNEGRYMSEEHSASTESTSAELTEPVGGDSSQVQEAALADVLTAGSVAVSVAATAAAAAAAAAAEKVAQWARMQSETLSKWKPDEMVEAKDQQGKWYRASVRGVSYSKRQVKINFGGWDSKWDEWVRVKDRRVRDVQCPEATRIKTDGTPIWPKGKKRADEADDMDEMEMEEVDASAPAKLNREEQRNQDRLRRLEDEEQRRRNKEEKDKVAPSAYQIFLKEETARLMKENKGLKHLEAKQMARDEWKKRTGVVPDTQMGIIIGSVHQLYACLDEETVQVVATKLKVDADKLLSMNKAVYPGMRMHYKLMEGTLLKLPLRLGSGDATKEIKVLCKVQAVKNILTFAMKENETIQAIKKRVYAKEDIKIKEQTAVYANQRLDDAHTLADYNIFDESLVIIQVGSGMQVVESTNDAQEVEYDNRWMLSAAGKRFMDTKDGQAWLKTKAGMEWQKQKKEDEREEIKGKKEAQKEKLREERGETEPGAALKKFNFWLKTEIARLREQHPHMSHKMASDAARWSWKVHAGE